MSKLAVPMSASSTRVLEFLEHPFVHKRCVFLLEVLVKKLKISLQADGVTDRGKRKILFTNAGFQR